jgi:hypothetical protein
LVASLKVSLSRKRIFVILIVKEVTIAPLPGAIFAEVSPVDIDISSNVWFIVF